MIEFSRIFIPVKFKIEYLLLMIILGLALIVRLIGIGKGLPYLHHYDEPFVASRALLMLKEGDFNPHWFQYPGLMIYLNMIVDVLHYLYLMGKDATFTGLKDLIVDNPTSVQKGGFIWTISHPSFFLWNRGIIALMGTICIYFTYLIGKKLASSSTAGLVGASLLAFSATMVEHSRYITPNLSGVLFVLGTVYYAIQFNSDKKNIYLILSLIFSGLAISTKYNFALCLIAPIASYCMNFKQFKIDIISGSVICITVSVLVFLIVNPFTIIDLKQFLADMGKQVKHYKSGHGSHTIEPGLTHFKFQINEFYRDFGGVLLGLSLIGAVTSLKQKKGWLLMFFVATYMLYMVRQKVDFHRNFLVIYPFITIWIAHAVHSITKFLKRLTEKFKSKLPGHLLRVGINYSLLFILALMISFNARAEIKKARALSNHVETRSQLINIINRYAKDSYLKVAIAKELRLHNMDLQRLNVPYVLINHMDFEENISNFDLFVSGKFGSDKKGFRGQDSTYNVVYTSKKLIKVIEGRTINLNRFHRDPAIYIYKGIPMSPIKLTANSFNGWYKPPYKSKDEKEEIFIGASGGKYLSRQILFEAGKYELTVTVRGNKIRNETARIKFFLGDKVLKQIDTKSEFKEFKINLIINKTGTNRLSMEFINDFFNSEKNEDRNFYVKDISIKPLN